MKATILKRVGGNSSRVELNGNLDIRVGVSCVKITDIDGATLSLSPSKKEARRLAYQLLSYAENKGK